MSTFLVQLPYVVGDHKYRSSSTVVQKLQQAKKKKIIHNLIDTLVGIVFGVLDKIRNIIYLCIYIIIYCSNPFASDFYFPKYDHLSKCNSFMCLYEHAGQISTCSSMREIISAMSANFLKLV